MAKKTYKDLKDGDTVYMVESADVFKELTVKIREEYYPQMIENEEYDELCYFLELFHQDGTKYKSFISRKNAEISLTTKYKENKGYSHFIRLSVDSTNFVVFQCKKCGLFHIMQKNNYKRMIQKEANGNKAT